MLRHPDNSNLVLHTDSLFRGYPVQVEKGPLIANYLGTLSDALDNALRQYRRVYAFRCDLRFPVGMALHEVMPSNAVINRFIASLKAKIAHNRNSARRSNSNGYAHPCEVRFVWAREVGGINGRLHYHLVILLSADAFNSLGLFELGRPNLFNRLLEAWASALGISVSETLGLVEFPHNSQFLIRRDEPVVLANFFYRASYLCKAATKEFGKGVHAFGGSRI